MIFEVKIKYANKKEYENLSSFQRRRVSSFCQFPKKEKQK